MTQSSADRDVYQGPPLEREKPVLLADRGDIENQLRYMLHRYREKNPGGLWGFSISAVTFLVGWMGMMRPIETQAYLQALAHSADHRFLKTIPDLAVANARVAEEEQKLFAALQVKG